MPTIINTELKRRNREVLGVEELSEQDLQEIVLARVPAEYARLDALLEDGNDEVHGMDSPSEIR